MTIIWRQPLGLPECPYSYRWVLDFGPFAIRLHKWVADDDHRAFHDHPYWFVTLVLWGGYDDIHVGPCPCPTPTFTHLHVACDSLRLGSMRYRPATHRHTVQLTSSPTWALLLSGRGGRRWSFFDRITGKAMKRDKWFAERGHHPCDQSAPPVRLRPDGSRIA